ncbi:spore germination protein [Paenibacillus sp. WQ 127069]|uniref:Spore germination protein n=1 Tax=Paenibacillus baimaensis TaxID=2982185 RepID=A0ABT2UPP2_9BACL|nr:spore germination protein [Paenibacillus sp. WQ 127069]MCU6796619.1 spore germination protein [Paenibacillus sp. WQ 127069]
MSLFKWLIKKQIRSGKRQRYKEAPPNNQALTDSEISIINAGNFKNRLNWIRQQLSNCSDVVYHTFIAGPDQECALIYLRGMIDQKTIQEEVLARILSLQAQDANQFRNQIFNLKQLSVTDLTELTTLQEGVTAVLNGHALLLVEGEPRLLEFPFTSYQTRSIVEAPNEAVLRGPREAFIENLEVNLTLIRRRLKTPDFKTEMLLVGTKTQTKVIIAYVKGVCKQELIDEVNKRVSQIEIDGVLADSYLEDFIEDFPFSPFPQLQYSERPDTVTASLLEGRVAIMVDGSPIVLLAPTTLFMLMQSAEDYYQRYIAATWIRWIRYIFLMASLLLPSIYIAVTTFHPEMIPAKLLITVTSSREVVPFPALIEAIMMEISFEALREAAVRIPKSIGQAVSVIGALIIGTAAVQAGIVSAAMVIIVSLTGIASFIIPHFDLGLAFRLLRFPVMILAGVFGLFGISCGMLIIYIHLINLRSFGTPYLSPFVPLEISDLKDTFLRVPWWLMNKRPSLSGANRTRQQADSRKWAQAQEENGD